MEQREKVLVGILERLAGEMTLLEVKIAELLVRQDELAQIVDASSLRLRGKQDDAERSYDKLFDVLTRYRSDMLSLVNEQDGLNRNFGELQAELKSAMLTVDVTSKKLVSMEEKLARHEEAASEYYEHAYKQPDVLKDALRDTSRDFSMLHAETEKRFTELQREIAAQLKGFEHETARRLLLLDKLVTDMQVLIARTEPPEKKPFFLRRVFVRLSAGVRRLFRRLRV